MKPLYYVIILCIGSHEQKVITSVGIFIRHIYGAKDTDSGPDNPAFYVFQKALTYLVSQLEEWFRLPSAGSKAGLDSARAWWRRGCPRHGEQAGR